MFVLFFFGGSFSAAKITCFSKQDWGQMMAYFAGPCGLSFFMRDDVAMHNEKGELWRSEDTLLKLSQTLIDIIIHIYNKHFQFDTVRRSQLRVFFIALST